MSVKSNIIAEFRAEPIQTSCALAGILAAIGSFIFAWFLSEPRLEIATPANVGQTTRASLSIPNLLIVLSFSLAALFSGALFIRILGRKHPFHAFILSVVVAPLVAFLSVLVFCMVPPRQISSEAIASASDAAFYGTIVIFVAINGLPILKDFATTAFSDDKKATKRTKENEGTQDGLGFIVFMVLLVIGWSSFVGKGQSILVETLIQGNALVPSADQKSSESIPGHGEQRNARELRVARFLMVSHSAATA